ncbi:unnamed protein product, partial [Musa textilis]
MGQKLLIYSFVARGTMILAEYTEFKGNFTRIAAQCLEKLSDSNNKFSFNCDGHTFNYLVEDGYSECSGLRSRLLRVSVCEIENLAAFCIVAVESADREIPIAFLERVKEEFNKRYGGKAATAAANSLSREFGSKLKEHMQYCADHPEEISKMAKMQAQVSELKSAVIEKIEKVLGNKENVDVLVEKAKNLYSQAQDFRLQSTTSLIINVLNVLCVGHRPNVGCRWCGLALVIAIILVFYAITALSCVVRRIFQCYGSLQQPNAAVDQSLPVTVYRTSHFEEGIECAICLSELADGEEARLLPQCGH